LFGGSITKAIEVRGLTKVYSGGVKALRGLSIDVEEGSIHAVLGPNGAGKTTLIRILTTQLSPTSGSAKIFGLDVMKNAAEVRKLIGYVPQEVSLWTDLTGYENLMIYAKIYGIERDRRKSVIEEILELMELREASSRLVKTYSGGMFRRLEIACALMVRPKLMILDEPTIGLDPSARRIVWEKILEYKKEYNTTVFFATHYMDEAEKYANLVSMVVSGNVVETGTPEELKKKAGGDKVFIKIDGNASIIESALSNIDGVRILRVRGDEVEFNVSSALALLPQILSSIQAEGYKIKEIRLREATLDDAFIALTGKMIAEEEGNIRELVSERKMIRRGA
jgi:ABC-2 type transport system ATP-binding protein